MNCARAYAAIEIGLLTSFFVLGIWGPRLTGVTYVNVAACFLFFATMIVSAVLRRPNWRKSGFRFDNFNSGALSVTLMVVCALSAIVYAAQLLGVSFTSVPLNSAVARVFAGLAQQAVFLGYFYPLWLLVLQRPVSAAIANATWFGLIHYPDPALIMVAGLGGIFLNLLFLRIQNVFLMGLFHGVLSSFLVPIMMERGIMATARIGPPELSMLRSHIAREVKATDRIGICSRVLAPDQFGQPFDRRVERILEGKRDVAVIRQSLRRFFAAPERVFCVITRREYRQYIDADLGKNLSVLSDWYIWRDWKNQPHFEEGEGLLGLFRDRVLLVSNRPSS